jgi:hypothetical protein
MAQNIEKTNGLWEKSENMFLGSFLQAESESELRIAKKKKSGSHATKKGDFDCPLLYMEGKIHGTCMCNAFHNWTSMLEYAHQLVVDEVEVSHA